MLIEPELPGQRGSEDSALLAPGDECREKNSREGIQQGSVQLANQNVQYFIYIMYNRTDKSVPWECSKDQVHAMIFHNIMGFLPAAELPSSIPQKF